MIQLLLAIYLDDWLQWATTKSKPLGEVGNNLPVGVSYIKTFRFVEINCSRWKKIQKTWKKQKKGTCSSSSLLITSSSQVDSGRVPAFAKLDIPSSDKNHPAICICVIFYFFFFVSLYPFFWFLVCSVFRAPHRPCTHNARYAQFFCIVSPHWYSSLGVDYYIVTCRCHLTSSIRVFYINL